MKFLPHPYQLIFVTLNHKNNALLLQAELSKLSQITQANNELNQLRKELEQHKKEKSQLIEVNAYLAKENKKLKKKTKNCMCSPMSIQSSQD
ncbi:12944_t:CDS:2 [Cetraspora pellucida]|uniref:12944_t:CDS:1 n=1 Tax=Cetraspora pellucida TaxID=1433469 RepID=A0A9N9B429_9GLOM|nr:12944_t:CDS:2 [Cetraspora pellucida]